MIYKGPNVKIIGKKVEGDEYTVYYKAAGSIQAFNIFKLDTNIWLHNADPRGLKIIDDK
jgi:hypothetical protein